MKKYNYLRLALTTLVALYCFGASAQLKPLGAMYFQNQYLNNPAFAGQTEGLKISMGFRQQMNNIPGAPKDQGITADYALTEKAGLGINLQNDQAGLINRTRALASYAYHLPLNAEGSRLSFGLSLGFLNEVVDYSRLDGDATDAAVINFNQRETYIDGDFGIAYTGNNLTLQMAIPNLKSFFKKDQYEGNVADEARYFAAASYKISMPESFSIEPKICFRSVKGYHDILDVGGNLAIVNEKVYLTTFYHSSKNATFGMGAKLTNYLSILALYTSGTSPIRSQSSGDFEVNVKLELGKH